MKHKKGDSMNTLMLRLLVVVSVMGCFIVGNAWAWEMVAIDINTATAEDLATLPGLSATVAQNIVSFRNANGPFSAVDDLLKVEGMDQDKLNRIRDMLAIDINTATAEELATLPGLGATVAQNIASFRNVNGPFSAVDDLLKVEGMDQDKLNVIKDMVVIGEGSAPTQLPDVTSE
jgi:competence ComEA-like helix-hairpin-helix protein